MSTDVATITVYGSYAALADLGGHSGAFALLMLPYLAIAFWLRRRRFEPRRHGARGGVNLPEGDIDRVKSHLAKYYKKMGEEPPWERD
jgi:hypothetical protein